MRYNSMHKYYFVGIILAVLITSSGLNLLWEELSRYVLLGILYLLFSVYIVMLYVSKYRFYKKRYIILNKEDMIVQLDSKRYIINKNNLSSIFYIRHRNYLKIHHVVHIYLKDQTYIYFSSEINKFYDFKKDIKNVFPDKYHKGRKMCPEHFVVSEENLYKFLYGEHD